MKWLDNVPLILLLVVALFLGLAPFGAEPHLVEKIKMLFDGSLAKPIDIFDLVMHATPSVLLIVRLIRMFFMPSRVDE